jgi:AcrR family transcriptional regulator
MINTDISDLTVQQVAERAGQSLRTFYQYFSGKHELLLAPFEDDIGWTAEHLGQVVATVGEPLERVRRPRHLVPSSTSSRSY